MEDTVRYRGWNFISNSPRAMHKDFVQESSINRRAVKDETAYRKILSVLFIKIFHEIIFNGYEFHFRRLGKFLCIRFLPEVKINAEGKVVTNKRVNYSESFKVRRETGDFTKMVYFDNRETGGYIYKMEWDNTHSHFENKTYYRFKMENSLKKLFNASLTNNTLTARIVHQTLKV
jgi:hypothetical protein